MLNAIHECTGFDCVQGVVAMEQRDMCWIRLLSPIVSEKGVKNLEARVRHVERRRVLEKLVVWHVERYRVASGFGA